MIDTPPLVLLPDAFPLLRQADGVLIVSRLGENRRDVAARLRETLASVEAPVIGVIANGYKRPRGSSAYGYGYSYTHDYTITTAPGAIRTRRRTAPPPTGRPLQSQRRATSRLARGAGLT